MSFLNKIIGKHNEFTKACKELDEAQIFFDLCEPHQLDEANVRLTAAREKVDTMVKREKEIIQIVEELKNKGDI